jgi:transposase
LLLARLQVFEPWRGNVTASVALIDDLESQIAEINRRLKAGHADHPYIPLLMSAPGIGWVLAFTIAAEIGEIERFPSPEKLAAIPASVPASTSQATRIAAARSQSTGPPTCAGHCSRRRCTRSSTRPTQRYQRNKRRLGKQRGAKVAQIDIARRLSHAIWHMLSRNQQFAPRGAAFRLAA